MVEQDSENENSCSSESQEWGRCARWPETDGSLCWYSGHYKPSPKESSGSWSWTLEMSPSDGETWIALRKVTKNVISAPTDHTEQFLNFHIESELAIFQAWLTFTARIAFARLPQNSIIGFLQSALQDNRITIHFNLKYPEFGHSVPS